MGKFYIDFAAITQTAYSNAISLVILFVFKFH